MLSSAVILSIPTHVSEVIQLLQGMAAKGQHEKQEEATKSTQIEALSPAVTSQRVAAGSAQMLVSFVHDP